MNDKLLSLLGLCRKAGKITIGYDAVVASMAAGEAVIILCAEDISKNTYKKVLNNSQIYAIPCFKIRRNKDMVSNALGRLCTVVSINDAGFARKFKEYIQIELEE